MALCRLPFHMIVLARNIFPRKPAEEAVSYPSVTLFLTYIYCISAVFQTYPSPTHGTVTSKNPISPKDDRMNTSLVKDSLQADQANSMLSTLFFKYQSVTFSGHLSKPPVHWARDKKEPFLKLKDADYRSSEAADCFTPLLKRPKSTLPTIK